MLVLLSLFLQVASLPPVRIGSDSVDVFTSGSLRPKEPFAIYRIPALCRTHKGTLIAFAEARRSVSDQSSNILVQRRRTSGAASWGPLEIVARDEPASINNPCALATENKTWLMYQRYPAGVNERTASADLDPKHCCQTFLISSGDDGRTWSAPRDLTPIVKGPGIRSDASGPGIGIELQRGLHKGRLIFPLNEGANGAYNVFSVYSDDGGSSWRRGRNALKAAGLQPNEVQFVETADGNLRLNARNQASEHFRLTSLSPDGGATWDMVEAERELPDPVCQGSILRVSFSPNLIAFTNAASTSHRANGMLRFSPDDGVHWSTGGSITEGSFEYSCLCALPRHRMGLLYEVREVTASRVEGYRIRYETIRLPGAPRQ